MVLYQHDMKKPQRCGDTPGHDQERKFLMTTEYTTKGERGVAVTELSVDSFTRPDVSYSVRLYHKDGAELGFSCNCRATTHGKGCRKHVAIAPALLKIRALDFGSDRHEARLMDLAKRLYSKPRKAETARESYDLTLEVDRERFATPAMRRDSWARHNVVSNRCFGEVA